MSKLSAHGSVLDLSFPHVMGILNVTPDSFSDGGKYNSLNQAIFHANQMVNAGATLIDVGGESTRPGASEVSTEEELQRVIPVVEAITQRFEVWVSVDTSKAEVIKASANAGAHLINDIRALQEPGALQAAVASQLPVCLMHMQGSPANMQNTPDYIDIFREIDHFFTQRIMQCQQAGIGREKLLLDPGFGFGKSIQHNYQLLSRLEHFTQLNLPLMVGMSRKSMIGQLLNLGLHQRVSGSLACAVIAAIKGARIIRVHDVKETVEAMRIVEMTLRVEG